MPQHESMVDAAWTLLRAASALADTLDRNGRFEVFGADDGNGVRPLTGGTAAAPCWPGIQGSGGSRAWQPTMRERSC